MRAALAAALAPVLALALAAGAAATEVGLELDGAALSGMPLKLVVDSAGSPADGPRDYTVSVDGEAIATLSLAPGRQSVEIDARLPAGRHVVTLAGGGFADLELSVLPGWLSVLPPLVAIGLALAFKDVLLSLFLGVFSGALLLFGWNPVTAFARSIDRFVAPALADLDHARIIIFTTLLGGMVGIITRSGGTQGIVERLTPYATNARRGQLATWMLGVLVFFDDYANTLIVGSTMRPITDKLKISREKLAFIVDSTAAPVASVFPISTWIGFEIGLIAAAFTALELPFNAYATFVASIPYRFYPILALVLGFTIAATRKDFGPMLKAERRASSTGQVVAPGDTPLADYGAGHVTPPEGAPLRARNAILPILTVIAVTLGGLYATGAAQLDRASYDSGFRWLGDVFSSGDSFNALLWASLAGVTVALLLALTQRILSVRQATEAMVEGFKSMLMALVVLTLAWSIGAVCGDLHTADYVVGLTQGVLSPYWLPVLTFLLSAVISFATGTAWGTMAILMPLVIPISHGLSLAAGHGVDSERFYVFLLGTVSSVLAGSVWGDHCSPISDTTILSSMGSGCDHIAHVRTQMPYALSLGFIGMLVGDIPSAFGLSPWISLAVGAAIVIGGVFWLGKPSDRPAAPAARRA